MQQLYRTISMICFIVCLCIGYLVNRSMEIRRYTSVLIPNHSQARINFLNNTFCGKLVNGTWKTTLNQTEIVKRNYLLKLEINRPENEFQNLTCTEFITKNGFYSKDITDLEYNNSMAFTILIYKNFYQFQVLMRTLYTRSNFHCIHVDAEAPIKFYLYASKLSKCLDNVYLAKPRLKVEWGAMTILQAERLCQISLLKQSSKWHYHMTIAGSELPIQTNLNRIQILQLIPDKSRNDVSSFPQPWNRQTAKKVPPPGNITIYKGEFHSILTRDFIQAVHTHPFAVEFWSFLDGTIVPDEQFYPSLVRLPEFPGGKARVVSTYDHNELLSHYKVWQEQVGRTCESGRYHYTVCQFNYKDLMNIEKSDRLFANKFNQELDLVGIACWEQWLRIKQNHPQGIDPRNYIDKYPFTRRITNVNYSQLTTSKRN